MPRSLASVLILALAPAALAQTPVVTGTVDTFDYRFDASEYPVYRTLGAALKVRF